MPDESASRSIVSTPGFNYVVAAIITAVAATFHLFLKERSRLALKVQSLEAVKKELEVLSLVLELHTEKKETAGEQKSPPAELREKVLTRSRQIHDELFALNTVGPRENRVVRIWGSLKRVSWPEIWNWCRLIGLELALLLMNVLRVAISAGVFICIVLSITQRNPALLFWLLPLVIGVGLAQPFGIEIQRQIAVRRKTLNLPDRPPRWSDFQEDP